MKSETGRIPHMKTNTLSFILISLLTGFEFLQTAQAVVPPPDGGYPGGNTAEGQNALLSLTTGSFNTAVGFLSLLSNTTNSLNTAIGAGALLANTGEENTATGAGALFSNTTAPFNTANGTFALFSNTQGDSNTAVGDRALFSNIIGSANTAIGAFALQNNTSDANTATGASALSNNDTGNLNTAIGANALLNNTTGSFNTANGFAALGSNTIGERNTAIGVGALQGTVDGVDNTAVGLNALANNTSGGNNVALGRSAGSQQTTGSNNIYIGVNLEGTAGESDTCYIKSIFGQTSPGGSAVFIDANHKLGTSTSSMRFKEDIKPMDQASQTLFSLKPVAFRYKKEIDPAGVSQLGFVAEDVEQVSPDLVVRDKEGKPYSVRYDQVNAMLLNEFLKARRQIDAQQKQIEALAAGLQKVSAQLELDKPAPQTVSNNR
jgi:trimeric autotransporter adhesin